MWRTIPTRLAVTLLALSSLAIACGASSSPAPEAQSRPPATAPPAASGPERFGYEIVKSYPHDPGAFTQGLTIADGQLYEGTGLYGQSSLRRVDLQDGAALQRIELDSQYFGEGIAVVGDRIVQLTYQTGVGFVTTARPSRSCESSSTRERAGA